MFNLIKKSREKVKINLCKLSMRYFIFKYTGPAACSNCTTCQAGAYVALWPALEVTNEEGDT